MVNVINKNKTIELKDVPLSRPFMFLNDERIFVKISSEKDSVNLIEITNVRPSIIPYSLLHVKRYLVEILKSDLKIKIVNE